MRILITNDDGIHAEGLDICEKIPRLLTRQPCRERVYLQFDQHQTRVRVESFGEMHG